MRKLIAILISIALLFAFSACESAEKTTQKSAESEEEITEIVFNLDDYKNAIRECRKDIMENTVFLGNAGKWEANFLKVLGGTSDTTVEKAFSWLADNSEADREYVDKLHEKIRDEYAAIILWNIEGNEAVELDKYIRSMYDGYSSLYDCVTSNGYSYNSLVIEVNNALDLITDADSNLSLFID